MSNIKIFYHIYCIETTEDITRDQIIKIIFSGLYDKVDYILCFLVGESVYIESIKSLLKTYGKKIVIVDTDAESNTYERFTLLQIKKYININDKILYIHSKGVTRSNNKIEKHNVLDWRNCMEYYLIHKHEECIKSLNEFDVVGINYLINPKPHYSGNFWWATARYYNTLSDTIDYTDHINPELYICSGNPNVKCMYYTGLHCFLPYITSYPMKQYVDD